VAGTNQPPIGILIYLEFSIMLVFVFTKRLTLAGFMLTFCSVFALTVCWQILWAVSRHDNTCLTCLGHASPIEMAIFMFSPPKEVAYGIFALQHCRCFRQQTANVNEPQGHTSPYNNHKKFCVYHSDMYLLWVQEIRSMCLGSCLAGSLSWHYLRVPLICIKVSRP